MFRRGRRRRRMSPITQSVKNQGDTQQTILANANVLQTIAFGVDVGAPTKIIGNEVPTGAKVFSVDVVVNHIAGGGNDTGTLFWALCKLRKGQDYDTDFVSPDWTSIGLSDVRNQYIETHMDIYGTDDAGPIRYKRHIKIPKIYQRMRAGDSLILVVRSTSAADIANGFRYKYYM